MGHQELYHPSGRIERIFLRSLLVLAIFGQVCGGYVDFKQAVMSCVSEVPTGEQCCSSGAANCGSFGTTDMPDWNVSNILDMKYMLSPYGDAFNQDISRWDVSQVQSMAGMFLSASVFDADITSWDTSSLVASKSMFLYATAWLAKYQRKDGKEVWMGIACSSGGTPLPGDMSCFDGPPNAWQKRDLPPLPPTPPHHESPPPPAQAVSSPPPPFGNVPEVSPPPAPAYDPPTTSVGVGTVVLVAFIMLVIGFVSGYLVRLLRSKKGVPILDEDPDEENFERAPLSSDA
jgi:hypothetical protein